MAETAEGLPSPRSLRSRLDLVLQIDGHRADQGRREERKNGRAGAEQGVYISADRWRSVLQTSRGARIQGPCEQRSGAKRESDTVGRRTPV